MRVKTISLSVCTVFAAFHTWLSVNLRVLASWILRPPLQCGTRTHIVKPVSHV